MEVLPGEEGKGFLGSDALILVNGPQDNLNMKVGYPKAKILKRSFPLLNHIFTKQSSNLTGSIFKFKKIHWVYLIQAHIFPRKNTGDYSLHYL